MNDNKVSYGVTSWDENPNVPSRERSLDKRIPFLKFKDGSNIIRIVTKPYGYYAVRVKGPNAGKYGKRIKTAYPDVSKEKDPAISQGLREQKRYYVGAISRGTPEEPAHELGLIDMSFFGLYGQLQEIKNDPEFGPDLTGLDLNIRRNPKAGPANFYKVLPRPPSEMSEADLTLIKENEDELAATLVRLTTPSQPDFVEKQLQETGWTPEQEDASKNGSADVSDNEDDEQYTFKRPSAQAN